MKNIKYKKIKQNTNLLIRKIVELLFLVLWRMSHHHCVLVMYSHILLNDDVYSPNIHLIAFLLFLDATTKNMYKNVFMRMNINRKLPPHTTQYSDLLHMSEINRINVKINLRISPTMKIETYSH